MIRRLLVLCTGAMLTVGMVSGPSSASSGESGDSGIAAQVTGVVAQATGEDHSCAVMYNGYVYCWGANDQGQLGSNQKGVVDLAAYPVRVCAPGVSESAGDGCGGQYLSNARQVTAGVDHTCVLTSGSKVYCWGANDQGQLGINSTADAVIPTAVRNGSQGFSPSVVTTVTAGDQFTCATSGNSFQVFCWGKNDRGQLGANNSLLPYAMEPLAVKGVGGAGSLSDVVTLTAGRGHACATYGSGDSAGLACWGSNSTAQLGQTTVPGQQTCDGVACSLVPVAVPGGNEGFNPATVASVSAGGTHTCAVVQTKAYCWGDNGRGQLGNEEVSGPSTGPVAVDKGEGLTDASSVTASAKSSCAVTSSTSVVYCWGDNSRGQLGQGDRSGRRVTPVKVANGDYGFANKNVRGTVAGGSSYSHCVVKDSGLAFCWGFNGEGQLGNGSFGPERCSNEFACSVFPRAVQGQFVMMPTTVVFPETDTGKTVTEAIAIASSFERDVRLGLKASGDTAALSYDPGCNPIAPAATCTGSAVFTPTQAGSYGSVVRITAQNYTGPEQAAQEGVVELGMAGSAVTPPAPAPPKNAVVQMSPVEFGDVKVGNVRTVTMSVGNSGNAALNIQSVKVKDADDEFDKVSSEDTCSGAKVASGKVCTVQVRFFPRDTGPAAAVLEVTSNSVRGTDSTSLTGNGTLSVDVLTKPSPVRKLQVAKKKKQMVKTKWKKPKDSNPLPSAYETRIKGPGVGPTKKCKKNPKGKKCWTKWKSQDWVPNDNGWLTKKFKNLKAGSDYAIQVRAVNDVGNGEKKKLKATTKKKKS